MMIPLVLEEKIDRFLHNLRYADVMVQLLKRHEDEYWKMLSDGWW